MANDEAPFGVSINLNQYELRNARVQNLASDPGSPVEGQVWWKTGTKRLAIYDGSTTRELLVSGTIKNNDIASDAAIAISKLAVDPRDRSTHTGTQTASTISDFNTAVRSNRLDQMAVPAANVSLNSKKITNLADPTSDTDAANKKYVDTSISNAVTGVRQQAISVFAASGENLNDSVGGLKIDASNLGDKLPGVSSEDLVEGETLILVKDQSSANKNGIYVVDEWDGANNRWNLIRADVMSTWDDVPGRLIIVESGGFEDTIWLSTADQGGTLETTPITFTQLPMDVETITAGNGLQKTGSTLAVKLDGSTLSASSSGLKIADGGIQALQLAANAVETAKIKDGNVTAAKLATDAVETAKIKDGNVTAAKLATDAVETAKIKDGNVTAAKLATDAVETAKIKDGNVTTAKIANNAVTSDKLADGAVYLSGARTAGILPVAKGGTGSSDPVVARENLDIPLVHVRAVATTNLTGIPSAQGNWTPPAEGIDGIPVSIGSGLEHGDLILLVGQTNPAENGIYVIDWGAETTWALRRAGVMNTWDKALGKVIFVLEGTDFKHTLWRSTASPGGTLGTTPLTFAALPLDVETITAGNGLQKTGSTLAVKLDGSTLSASSSGLKIADGGIGTTQLANNAVTGDKIADSAIALNGTKVTGVVPVNKGGTGASSAAAARTNLGVPGKYTNGGVHAAGTTISIPASTHGLGSGRAKIVQVWRLSDGVEIIANKTIASNGDVTITFGSSVGANTHEVVIVG